MSGFSSKRCKLLNFKKHRARSRRDVILTIESMRRVKAYRIIRCPPFRTAGSDYRAKRVVRTSQWSFLIMIAVGTLIFGSSMIAMSFDDHNSVLDTERPVVVACTGQVWLVSIGFTTVFSALFSKTWRINRIWHNPSGFRRMKVTAKDVIAPFVALMSVNVLTLTLMTVFTPLEFVRHVHEGTDNWNRVISTYGRCESTTDRPGGAVPYLATLLILNIIVILFALFQAYQARSIQTEFSESHYIAIVIMSLFQVSIIAGPL